MKIAHATALALVSWYLMVPPVESCMGAFSGHSCPTLPLSQWQIKATRSSAEKCEQVQQTLNEKGQSYLVEIGAANRPHDMRMYTDEASARSMVAAQCVASDDPRLKSKGSSGNTSN